VSRAAPFSGPRTPITGENLFKKGIPAFYKNIDKDKDLEVITEKEIQAIKKGTIFKGMSEKALYFSIGLASKEKDWGSGHSEVSPSRFCWPFSSSRVPNNGNIGICSPLKRRNSFYPDSLRVIQFSQPRPCIKNGNGLIFPYPLRVSRYSSLQAFLATPLQSQNVMLLGNQINICLSHNR
jgi:hypothetical protein